MKLRVGIDLGGTKIEAAALGADGVFLARERHPTPRHDYDGTVDAIASLVTGFEERFGGPAAIGIGMPGSPSPATGLVRNANSTWLNGRAFGDDLRQRLDREVRLANDANCFALSEASDGAAQGARVVFGVILGTGVGGGIVVDGRVLDGLNGVAGEWGHNPLPAPNDDERPGPPCYCGRRGCIETFLSGPGLLADYQRSGGSVAVDASAVVRAAEHGEPQATAALARYEERLARALASIVNVLDPDVIVLGGGLSNVTRWYDSVPRLWTRRVFSDVVATRLVPPMHGDSSGVRGAAWLAGSA